MHQSENIKIKLITITNKDEHSACLLKGKNYAVLHIVNLFLAFCLRGYASCYLSMIFLGSLVDSLDQNGMGINWIMFPSMGRRRVSMSTFDKM